MKRNIWGLNLQELETWVVGNGFPRFRAKQLRDYLYKRHIFHLKIFPENARLVKRERTD